MDCFTFLFGLVSLFLVYHQAAAVVVARDSCKDEITNKTHAIGDRWPVKGESCMFFLCKLVEEPDKPGHSVPRVIRLVCSKPEAPDGNSKGCEMVNRNPAAAYPICCPELACTRNGITMYVSPRT